MDASGALDPRDLEAPDGGRDGEPRIEPGPDPEPPSEPGADGGAMTPLGAESLAAPGSPAIDDPDDASLLALIDRLSSLLDRTDLTELEVQVGDTGLVLRKPSAIAPPPIQVAVPAVSTGAAGGAPATAAADGARTNGAAPAEAGPPPRPSVKAPLTGIWYSAPAPGSAPFVSQGGEVNTGQVIGLIEAMKLFNEIKSDLSGRVAKIHAENGKLVKARQPLIEVEPL